jgi:hypothetical protein
MQKKKKWILLGLAAIVVAAVAIFLALRYVPLYKIMGRPSSDDMAFVNQPRTPDSVPCSLFFDFEVDTTAKTPSGLYRGIAHSGQYSTKAFGKNSFSVSMEKLVSQLGVTDLSAVALSAWVYVYPSAHEPQASLVFTVTNTVGVNTCWKGVSLHGPLVPRGKWIKMSGQFNLSDVKIRPDDKIQVYFWNNSDTDILADDFYIVFGSEAPRKGDSARVDMTRGIPYLPKFNLPPFRTAWLQKEEIGNQDSPWLVSAGSVREGEITPKDQVVTGFFLPAGTGMESVFILKPDGSLQMFQFCTKDRVFRNIQVDCAPGLSAELAGARVIRGPFMGNGSDQLLFITGKGILLAAFDKGADPCGKAPQPVTLKELWRSSGKEISGVAVTGDNPVTVCDLNGDRQSEILLVKPGGSWEVLAFRSGNWVTLATGEEDRMREWDPRFFEFTITPGRFNGVAGGDQVLTVFADKAKKIRNYSLVRFVQGEKKFVNALKGTEGSSGKTIGLDSLKLTDRYFQGNFQPGGSPFFLRYNRDWRYDLKKLRFNDSTYMILENVDFTGFLRDCNPKYFETLELVPGRLISPAQTSLLVIARNSRPLSYLPNTIQVYSFQPKTKP